MSESADAIPVQNTEEEDALRNSCDSSEKAWPLQLEEKVGISEVAQVQPEPQALAPDCPACGMACI